MTGEQSNTSIFQHGIEQGCRPQSWTELTLQCALEQGFSNAAFGWSKRHHLATLRVYEVCNGFARSRVIRYNISGTRSSYQHEIVEREGTVFDLTYLMFLAWTKTLVQRLSTMQMHGDTSQWLILRTHSERPHDNYQAWMLMLTSMLVNARVNVKKGKRWYRIHNSIQPLERCIYDRCNLKSDWLGEWGSVSLQPVIF